MGEVDYKVKIAILYREKNPKVGFHENLEVYFLSLL